MLKNVGQNCKLHSKSYQKLETETAKEASSKETQVHIILYP